MLKRTPIVNVNAYCFISLHTGDVFAGVGPISILAAKKVKHVYANDLNPCAVEYLESNSVLNRLERKIEVWMITIVPYSSFSRFL